jgi:hypothetical protein
MIVDSYRFLPRSFRPMYEGRGAFPGEEAPVWAPFEKRLAGSRIALLTSAGIYVRSSQPSFDVDREQSEPEWGDPSWRSIPCGLDAAELEVAHLHISHDDIRADPEVALPMRTLDDIVSEGIVGSATAEHLSVMGYQERSLEGWRRDTAPQVIARLREQQADGLILAPA